MFVLQADTFLKEILMLAKITHSVQSGYVELVQDVISDMAACYDPWGVRTVHCVMVYSRFFMLCALLGK